MLNCTLSQYLAYPFVWPIVHYAIHWACPNNNWLKVLGFLDIPLMLQMTYNFEIFLKSSSINRLNKTYVFLILASSIRILIIRRQN